MGVQEFARNPVSTHYGDHGRPIYSARLRGVLLLVLLYRATRLQPFGMLALRFSRFTFSGS